MSLEFEVRLADPERVVASELLIAAEGSPAVSGLRVGDANTSTNTHSTGVTFLLDLVKEGETKRGVGVGG